MSTIHLHEKTTATPEQFIAALIVVRDGKNLKGRVLGAIVGTVGKGHLSKALANTVKAVEARNQQTSAQ